MIIGLCGYARVGKDELANVLGREHGFRRYAFADVLKEAALDINPWVAAGRGHVRLGDLVAGIGWDAAKVHAPDARVFLQSLGESMRKINRRIWLDEVIQQILRDRAEKVVITDVRYLNEARWVQANGFLVRVTRPGVGPANEHVSEQAEIKDLTFRVFEFFNYGDLDDLEFHGARLPHVLKGLIGVTAP